MEEKYKLIKNECLNSKIKNPIELIISIMKKDFISIHGPEHHFLDGACFLTALHNSGEAFDLEGALDELTQRAKAMPGAACGLWGVCGSASSVRAALAVIHQTSPLSSNRFYKDNLYFTSNALKRIADAGGPRCCKRNAFLSLLTAIDFVREHYGIEFEKYDFCCSFSHLNKQCISVNCPFFNIEG